MLCYFRITLTYLITVHERNGQTDGQTDRQNYYGTMALCTKVHRVVKKASLLGLQVT